MKNEEYNLQKKCVQWFSYQYPQYKGLLYMNMNNPRSKINGALMKAAGMISGVADLTYLHNGKAYFIELKTPTGKISANQKEWGNKVIDNGFCYTIIRTFDEFKNEIKLIHN